MPVDTSDFDKQAARIDGMAAKLEIALTKEMTSAMTDVSTIVKDDKLSGQVLNTVTGRLRRSVHPDVSNDGGTIVGTVGTNVEYARIQEMGGIIWRIPRMQTVYRKTVRGELQNGFVKKSQSNFATDHAVAGYKITIPERSYLRSTLRAQTTTVRDRLAGAATKAVNA